MLGGRMQYQYLQYAMPVLFTLVVIEALYSKYKGLGLYRLNDSLVSLACGLFTLTFEVFAKAGMIALYIVLYQSFALLQWADNQWQSWLAALLVYDFIYYWAHRYSHEINFMWGGHVPHHQSEDYNFAAALRQGALQDLMHWPLFLPMAVIGFSPELFVAQIMISKFTQFPLHTQAIGKLPFIEGILNTPSAHRVHHGINDAYIDKNHGGLLMLWDRLFGTYAAEEEEVVYGVRKPYHSYNAFWAHFDWLSLLWKDARYTRCWQDKIKLWFMPTGWRPDDVKQQRQRVDWQSLVKFDLPMNTPRRRKALALFAVLMMLGNCLVFFNAELSWGMKGGIAVVISFGLWGLDVVMRGRG